MYNDETGVLKPSQRNPIGLWNHCGAVCLGGYQPQISGWAALRHKETDEVSDTHPEELCSVRRHLQRGERRQIRDQGEGINWYKIRGDLCLCVLHPHVIISSLDLDSLKGLGCFFLFFLFFLFWVFPPMILQKFLDRKRCWVILAVWVQAFLSC